MSFFKEVGKAAIHGLVGSAVAAPGEAIGQRIAGVISRLINPKPLPKPTTKRKSK